MHYLMSFLVCHHLDEEERAGCFVFIVFWMSCYCKCHVALPHSVVGWTAVCDSGIFLDRTHLHILHNTSSHIDLLEISQLV